VRLAENTLSSNDVASEQAVLLSRKWLAEHWPNDEKQEMLHAIERGVVAELRLRDNREYGIPLNGDVTVPVLIEDNRRGMGMPTARPGQQYQVDPVLSQNKHGLLEMRNETTRRFYAWAALRPDPECYLQWRAAVEDDDGKDAAGQWLCGPHRGNHFTGGFVEALPKWLFEPHPEWCLGSYPPELRGGLDAAQPFKRGPGRPRKYRLHELEPIVCGQPVANP